jgi:hypothetical protein
MRARHLDLALALPTGSRAAPGVFPPRYRSLPVGDRGGIVVRGALLTAPLE